MNGRGVALTAGPTGYPDLNKYGSRLVRKLRMTTETGVFIIDLFFPGVLTIHN